ncbi:MAG: fatty acid cis/trans isomerase [Oceanicoccus sp.]
MGFSNGLKWVYEPPKLLCIFTVFLLSACTGSSDTPDLTPDLDWDVLTSLSNDDPQLTWREDVQPILEQRCVVCHGCYDAPCQLKLTSYEGLARGANPAKVYDGSRIRSVEPTRLGIDANNPLEWQAKGFHAVLGADQQGEEVTPQARLRQSALYKMLRLKQLNPQPRTGILPPSVTTSLDRKQSCAVEGEFDKFASQNPMWGMPYGLPNLADKEYRTLVRWLAEGASAPEPAKPSAEAAGQIQRWEVFLNTGDNKHQLVSRYLYEHLFTGHMHFEGTSNREFYRLVRSFTPPGEPINEIPTVRPFNAPGVDEFWYRLRLFDASIVAKSHLVYSLSDAKMARYQQLFIEPEYEVAELPTYVMPDAANPFKTFALLPAQSRYEFLLDDSRYFIMGFIKGPVCRGQIALNVIEDQFWVMFENPEAMAGRNASQALNNVSDYLQMPSSTETFNLLAAYGRFWKDQKKYQQARTEYFLNIYEEEGDKAFAGLWKGNGENPNAALTIFRNFDSAAVEFGLIGDYPETAWVIDYPLFERIHYLLVAGFDVYGNVGHQLNSRLFMDFLRMEGEDNFLTYLPAKDRKRIRDQWYKGVREGRSKYFQEPMAWMTVESPIEFVTDDPQLELYQLIESHLGTLAGPVDYLNRCSGSDCVSSGATEKIRTADKLVKEIQNIDRKKLAEDADYLGVAPDNIFLRVRVDGEADIHYTILRNKSYNNLGGILADGESINRDPTNDTYSMIRGFSGSYPNFFLTVDYEDLENLLSSFRAIASLDEYQKFIARYGIRRTDQRFWEYSDWFHKKYAEEQPLEYGAFDLNRYGNF